MADAGSGPGPAAAHPRAFGCFRRAIRASGLRPGSGHVRMAGGQQAQRPCQGPDLRSDSRMGPFRKCCCPGRRGGGGRPATRPASARWAAGLAGSHGLGGRRPPTRDPRPRNQRPWRDPRRPRPGHDARGSLLGWVAALARPPGPARLGHARPGSVTRPATALSHHSGHARPGSVGTGPPSPTRSHH